MGCSKVGLEAPVQASCYYWHKLNGLCIVRCLPACFQQLALLYSVLENVINYLWDQVVKYLSLHRLARA